MSTSPQPDDVKRAYAFGLLAGEYTQAFERGDSRELVSTPACINDEVQLGELLLAVLDSEKRLGTSVALRMVCECIASAAEDGEPAARNLIDHLSCTLAEWQIELLHGRGAM